MTSKVSIKVGKLELEFEGSEKYLKDELPQLVEFLHSLSPPDPANEGKIEELEPTSERRRRLFE